MLHDLINDSYIIPAITCHNSSTEKESSKKRTLEAADARVRKKAKSKGRGDAPSYESDSDESYEPSDVDDDDATDDAEADADGRKKKKSKKSKKKAPKKKDLFNRNKHYDSNVENTGNKAIAATLKQREKERERELVAERERDHERAVSLAKASDVEADAADSEMNVLDHMQLEQRNDEEAMWTLNHIKFLFEFKKQAIVDYGNERISATAGFVLQCMLSTYSWDLSRQLGGLPLHSLRTKSLICSICSC